METLSHKEEPEEPTYDNNSDEEEERMTQVFVYEDAPGIPRKFFYPLLATALLLFVIACVIVSTVVYKCAQSKDYTLIKKAPSNIYIDIDSPPEKKIEVRTIIFILVFKLKYDKNMLKSSLLPCTFLATIKIMLLLSR